MLAEERGPLGVENVDSHNAGRRNPPRNSPMDGSNNAVQGRTTNSMIGSRSRIAMNPKASSMYRSMRTRRLSRRPFTFKREVGPRFTRPHVIATFEPGDARSGSAMSQT